MDAPMSTEPIWRRYLRFVRDDVDADVDDELRFHLEMRQRDFEARGAGCATRSGRPAGWCP
jgi:hypothetical protein